MSCYNRCWVEQYVESENSEGILLNQRLKLDLVRIFEKFYHRACVWYMWRQFHTGLRLQHRVFGGKICNVLGGGDKSFHERAFFVHKYPLILRYNDWLVLEIITQWTWKRFCGKEKNTCSHWLIVMFYIFVVKDGRKFRYIVVLDYKKFYWKFDNGIKSQRLNERMVSF